MWPSCFLRSSEALRRMGVLARARCVATKIASLTSLHWSAGTQGTHDPSRAHPRYQPRNRLQHRLRNRLPNRLPYPLVGPPTNTPGAAAGGAGASQGCPEAQASAWRNKSPFSEIGGTSVAGEENLVVEGLVNIHRHGNLWGPGDLHQEWQTVIARQVNAGLSGNSVVLVFHKAQDR